MTYEEMERSIQELRDAQLVQVHLMDRIELNMDRLVDTAQNHERRLEVHEDGIAEMRAAMTRLFERMDRFIQGLERGNGQK